MVVPNGHGELKFSNGYLYTGDFVNGTFEGHGTYKSKDHVYTGPFKNGTFNETEHLHTPMAMFTQVHF